MDASNVVASERDALPEVFSRRTFLKQGVTAAGISLPLHSVLATNTTPRKVRIGVVGVASAPAFNGTSTQIALSRPSAICGRNAAHG